MADDRTIRVRLQAEIASYVQGMRTAGAATVDFGRQVSGAGSAATADIEKVGRAALVMSGALAIGLGLSAKAAIDWESAWAGVTKTVEGTEAELAELHDGLREMATELPATHAEIAAVAEAAGALGIATPAVEDFTRTMIDLGETTDLTADQAAEAFARIANIMQTPQDEFDRMGSTVVDLGNNLAATESEITELALRIAGAGAQIGLAESDVLGFAGAIASVGIEAEAGGTAISRVFVEIDEAVRTGSDTLTSFAEVAGMTAEEFSAAYRADAAGATATFIEGLNGISEAGGNVFGVLEDLSLDDIRVRDAMLRLAGAGDLVRQSLDLGAEAWEENTALADEAAKRYETTSAQIEMLRNQVVDLGIDIGGELLPMLRGTVDTVGEAVTGFREMPDPMRDVVAVTGGLTTALVGTVGVVGTLGPKVKAARDSMMSMGTAGQFLGRNLGAMATGLGAASLALAVYTIHVGKQAQQQAEAEAAAQGFTDAIIEQGRAVGATTAELAGSAILEGELGEKLREAGVDLGVFTDAVHESGSELEGMDQQFSRFASLTLNDLRSMAREAGVDIEGLEGDVAALAVTLGEAGLAGTPLADELLRLAESGELSRGEISDLLDRLGDQGAAFETGARDAENLAEAEEQVGTAADDAAPLVGDLALSTEDLEQAAKDAEEAVQELLDTLHASVDPVFGLIDAQDGLSDAYAELDRVMRDNESTAEDVEDAQRGVRDAAAEMDQAIYELAAGLADGSVSAEAFEETLARWVEQGSITEGQAANLRDRMAEVIGNADVLAAKDEINFVVTWSGQAAQEALAEAIRQAAELDRQLRNLAAGGGRQHTGAGGGNSFLAAGGPVYAANGFFTPRGTDTVPAMLTPGEFVMRKSAVDRFGTDFMSALNAGQLRSVPFAPGAAGGGAGAIDRSLHVTVEGGARVTNRTVGDIVWAARRAELEVPAG